MLLISIPAIDLTRQLNIFVPPCRRSNVGVIEYPSLITLPLIPSHQARVKIFLGKYEKAGYSIFSLDWHSNCGGKQGEKAIPGIKTVNKNPKYG
jgi:hypothetical protein